MFGLLRNFYYLYIRETYLGGEKKEHLATQKIDVIFRCN